MTDFLDLITQTNLNTDKRTVTVSIYLDKNTLLGESTYKFSSFSSLDDPLTVADGAVWATIEAMNQWLKG